MSDKLGSGVGREAADAAAMRECSAQLLDALWKSHKPIMLHLRAKGRTVADPRTVNRGKPPLAWPDCPAHLKGEYDRLARKFGGHNARRMMEAML